MTSTERIKAMINNETVDRVGAVSYTHLCKRCPRVNRKSLISWKDKFLENTDKYIAVLYIGSNTGRNVNSEVRKSGWNVF